MLWYFSESLSPSLFSLRCLKQGYFFNSMLSVFLFHTRSSPYDTIKFNHSKVCKINDRVGAMDGDAITSADGAQMRD